MFSTVNRNICIGFFSTWKQNFLITFFNTKLKRSSKIWRLRKLTMDIQHHLITYFTYFVDKNSAGSRMIFIFSNIFGTMLWDFRRVFTWNKNFFIFCMNNSRAMAEHKRSFTRVVTCGRLSPKYRRILGRLTLFPLMLI